MLFSCLFLVLLSSACFSQANAHHDHASHQAQEHADDMSVRGQTDDYWRQKEEADEFSMAMRASGEEKKTQKIIAENLDSVQNLMDTLLKGVKDAKAGDVKGSDAARAELKKELKVANKYADELNRHNRNM